MLTESVEDITARATIDLNQALLAFRRGETKRAAKNYDDVCTSLNALVGRLEAEGK